MHTRVRNIIKAANLEATLAAGNVVPLQHNRGEPGEKSGPNAATEECEPTLVLHREGEQIEAIELTCGCGKTTVIQCLYEGESS